MEFDYDTAVGLKFFVDPLEIKGKTKNTVDSFEFMFKSNSPDLIDEIDDPSGIFTGGNSMTCKFLDEKEGIMYVHFNKEVLRKDLFMFEDREMIFKKI